MDFGTFIISCYVTLFSVVLAGIFTSAFCKIDLFNFLKFPLDFNIVLKDGYRLFGDHKTFKGLLGYIFFNIVFYLFCYFIFKWINLNNYNFFSMSGIIIINEIITGCIIGFLLGFAYALFELPNSFIKRRLNIIPGKTVSNWWKIFFIFFDQADSIFGIVLVVCLFYPLSIGGYFLYVIIGSFTHILINMLLYFLHLRKNMF